MEFSLIIIIIMTVCTEASGEKRFILLNTAVNPNNKDCSTLYKVLYNILPKR
jgi:hypothetical protein